MSDLPLLPLPTRADPADATAPRLLIIYTGGTVGMALNDSGELVPMEFGRLDQQMPELARLPFRLAAPEPARAHRQQQRHARRLAVSGRAHWPALCRFRWVRGAARHRYHGLLGGGAELRAGAPGQAGGVHRGAGAGGGQPLRCPAQPGFGPRNCGGPPPPCPHRARARGVRVFQRCAHSRHPGQKGGKPAVCRFQK